MKSPLLLGLCAGLVSAVLFAGAAVGPLFARLPLFVLTPFPLMLAGLAFGWRMAALAGCAATLGIIAAAGLRIGGAFAVTEALPVLALTYLALLHRTTAGASPEGAKVEWYPVGRLVLWMALLSGVLAVFSLLALGGDTETLRKALRSLLETFLQAQVPAGAGSAPPLGPEDLDTLTNTALALFPAFMAMSWMWGLLFALWLAARILSASGRLTRPWPDLPAMSYPRGTPLVLALATAAPFFLSGYPALAASAFAGSLFLAYLLLGLAIAHFVTRGWTWRPVALWTLYAALILLSSMVAPLLAILGLAESIVPLRRQPSDGPHTRN